MKTELFNKKKILILLSIFLLVLLPVSYVLAQAEGEGEGEGEDGAEIISNRIEADEQQTQTESETLSDLQQQDLTQCTAEVNGSGDTTPTNTSAPGTSSSQPDQTSGGDEKAVRDKLAAEGITVNKGSCNGQAYQLVTGGCTDVTGLPQHSIDRLGEIQDETGSNIILTGGTEAGHSASAWGHAPGNNVVDLQRNNSSLNTYINSHTTNTWSSSYGTWHQLDNGDRFLDEGDHWHAQLRGTTGSATTAIINNSKKMALSAWVKIKNLIMPIVEAVSSTNLNITLGTQMVDLNNTSTTQINQIYANLSTQDINRLFSSTNSSQSQALINQLNFSNLNNTFSNLNSSNLNRVVNQLNSSSLNNLVNGLVPSSLDNIVVNVNSGSLNSLVSGLSHQMQSELFNNISTGAVDTIINNLGSGSLDGILDNLNQGAINNVFNQVSSGLINNVVDSLGMSSLNQVFNNLGSQTLNQVMNNVTSGTLNNVLPDLGSGALDDIFSGASPEILTDALDGVSADVLDDVTNSLSPETLTNLDDSVTEMLGPEIAPGGSSIIPQTGTPLDGVTQALTGSGLYVPVVEQDGKLMQLTTSIDTTEKQIKDLSIQICTHLKAIRRIQVKFETAMTEEAAVRRTAATEIEKYKQGLFGDEGAIKNGGARIDENGEEVKDLPLFVVNNKVYWEAARQEADKILFDEISQSTNYSKDEVSSSLGADNSLSLNSSFTEQDMVNLGVLNNSTTNNTASGRLPIISSLFDPFKKIGVLLFGGKTTLAQDTTSKETLVDQEYWYSWRKLIEPRNNRYGSYLIAADKRDVIINTEVQSARDTAIQGQGFLPTKTCIEKTSDGKSCVTWGTIQPGIIIKETDAAAMNSRLRQYEQANTSGEVAQGNEPDTNETLNNEPSSQGGGAPGVGNSSASQIPNSAQERQSSQSTNIPPSGQDGGGQSGDGGDGQDGGEPSTLPGGLDISNISNLIDLMFNNSDTPNQSELNWLQWLISLFSSITEKLNPIIFAGDKDRSGEDSLIYWFSPNSTTCVTDNAWPSATTTAKAKGANLGTSSSLRITYPATTSLSVSYLIKCTNSNGSTNKEVIIEKR